MLFLVFFFALLRTTTTNDGGRSRNVFWDGTRGANSGLSTPRAEFVHLHLTHLRFPANFISVVAVYNFRFYTKPNEVTLNLGEIRPHARCFSL